MTGRRLDRGGRIDRNAPLHFTWNGVGHIGYSGDTIASALMATGARIVGRSFKYHRPRGIMSAGVDEAGAIVTVGSGAEREPNVRATTAELVDGMNIRGQNAWPSTNWDVAAVNDVFGRFFGAGFYYKTFMGVRGRGTWEWMQFEKAIRRAAGMGRASREPDPAHYEIVHDHCDVLVVGSGPAGLVAARDAAAAGLDVVLAEQDFELGGSLLTGLTDVVGEERAEPWRAARIAELSDRGVRVWTRTTAFGLYDHGVVGLLERVPSGGVRERMRILRARHVVLATGALERPFAFGNNDRPGVMLASAAATYVTRFGVAPGRRAIVATNNDSAYDAAATLARAGIETTLIETRGLVPHALGARAEAAGVRLRADLVPIEAHGRRGVTALEFGRRHGDGYLAEDRLPTDIVAVSGGWSPVVNLISHRGIKPVWSDEISGFVIEDTNIEPVTMAGAAAGHLGTNAAVESGARAAEAAVAALRGGTAPAKAAPEAPWANPLVPLWEVRDPGRKLKSFVDPQNDVTAEDVRLAHREGFVSVEHMKRYTTLGMSTDQGKFGNVVGLALMAEATGKTMDEAGTTTFRPPYTPVSIGAIAGDERGAHWRPTRHTPMRAENRKAGAVFIDAGFWDRPWYYPNGDERMGPAALREARRVRSHVGMVDVSTLGKIMVQGPDAGEFLNRVYSNPFAKLPVGRARYGLMLRDDGIVFDDGTTWRLSETDWLMTTTTANAGGVMNHLQTLLQTRWSNLRVHLTSVTDQYGGVAVAGPKARDVLAAALPGIDFSADGYPFMAVRQGTIETDAGKIPVVTARLSFSGEMAWEVMTPSDFAPALFRRLREGVESAGGVLYGLEAMDCLRVEKGHVTSRELDGRMTAADMGLGAMASTKKDYVGRVLAGREELVAEDRPRLVGLVPRAKGARFRAGSILFAGDEVAGHGLGHVTSVADSPAVGSWIGLAYLEGGLDTWEGRELRAESPVDAQSTMVRVVSPHFIDPEGERMHG